MKSLNIQFLFLIAIFIPSAICLLGLPIGLPLLECHITCLLCSGPNADQCLSCLAGLLPILGTCQCPDGKYFSLLACANCDPSCLTCDGGTAANCLSCHPGGNLYASTCYPPCASNQYFDTATRTCLSCNPLCQTCNGPASNQCTSCASAALVNGACQCPSGQYVTPLGGCGSCGTTCKECSGPSNNQCTACVSGMVLQSNQCKCLTGFYMTTSPLGCQACDSMCLGCSGPGPNSCTSCKNNLVLAINECKCPSNTFYNPATSSCLPCDPLCSSCTGPNSNECTGCKNNIVLSGTLCGCPIGAFLDTNIYTCKSCDSTCIECDGPADDDCTACDTSSGLSLLGGYCICSGSCSCAAGSYYDSILLTCKPCNPTCETCDGPSSTECLSCRVDYSWTPNYCQCSSAPCSCPSGTYFEPGTSTCEPCYQTCAECSGPSSSDCTLCKNNLVDSSGSCVCPGHTYQDTSLFCFACDPTCDTCSGPLPTDCDICKPSLVPIGALCQCPSATYFDTVAGGCSPCEGSCSTCSGPDQSQCLSCSSTKTLDMGYCIDICTPSQYRETDKSCQLCDPSCATCYTEGPDQCSSCTPPKTLTSGTCPDIDNGCHYQCDTCLSDSYDQCLTCKGNLLLVEGDEHNVGYCDTTCPIEYSQIDDGPQKKCIKKIGLDNRLGQGSNLHEIELNFGRDISPFLGELTTSIEVALMFREEQPPITYNFRLKPSSSNTQSLILNFTFYGHLLPRNVLYITYNLPTKNTDETNSTIYVYRKVQTIRLNEFYGYGSGMKDYVNTAALISSVTLTANQIFSWTSSLVLRSIHSVRSKVVEDMIGFFIFLNVDFTPNFIQFCNDGMNSFELIMPNLFINVEEAMNGNRLLEERILNMRRVLRSRHLQSDDDEDDLNPIDRNLDNKLFLANHGAAVTMVGFAFGCIVIVEILRLTLRRTKRLSLIKKYLDKISYSISYNFMIGHFLGEYQSYIFFSLLQVITSLRIVRKSDSLNISLSLFFFVCCLVCLPSVFYLLHVVIKKLRTQQQAKKKTGTAPEDPFLERFEMMYESFKRERYRDLLYTHFLVLRCFGFALVLLFMSPWPLGQIIYLLASTIAIIAYLIYYKPLKNKQQQILTLIYEFLFLSVSAMTLVLHVVNLIFIDDIETRNMICLIILTLATSMFALNLISLVFEVMELKERIFKRTDKIAPVSAAAANAILKTKPSLPLLKNGSQEIQNEENQSSDSNNPHTVQKGLSRSYRIVKHPSEIEQSDQENQRENVNNDERKYELVITETDSPTKKVDESSILLKLSEEYSQQGKKVDESRLFSRERTPADPTWIISSHDTINTNENLLLSHLKLNRTENSLLSPSREADSSSNKERLGERIRKRLQKQGSDQEDQDGGFPVLRLEEVDRLVTPKKNQKLHNFSSMKAEQVKEKILDRQKDKLNISSQRLDSAGTVDGSQIGSLVYEDNVVLRGKRRSHKTQLKGSTLKP